MSESFQWVEKEAGNVWARYFNHLIDELESQNRINPDHAKRMNEFNRIYNCANQSFIHINSLDKIVRGIDERKDFLKTNSGFSLDMLDEIWFDVSINASLRGYEVISPSSKAKRKHHSFDDSIDKYYCLNE